MLTRLTRTTAAGLLLALPLLALSLTAASAPPSREGGAAEAATYLKPLVEELTKTWPGNRVVNIVVHGHSVPAGYFKTPAVHTMEAYPHLLHLGLAERFPTATINVIVTAIGGESSPSGAARFGKDVLGHQPDLITIDYGLNDRGPGLEKARAAWTHMIRRAKEQGIPVLLLTPTADTNASFDDDGDPLNQHAEQIRQLAAELGVGLVDSLALFEATGEALPDHMSQANHPNARGHRLVAEELLSWFPR